MTSHRAVSYTHLGAGIGSGDDIDMAGSIVISGGNINVKSNDGAGIGSSDDGAITKDGIIHIGGNADVNITTKDSPGVGSARCEQMNGSIAVSYTHLDVYKRQRYLRLQRQRLPSL